MWSKSCKTARCFRDGRPRQALILLSGLPGTGKTFLARKIIERLPSVLVVADLVRKVLFPQPAYTGEESMWVHRVANVAIERMLKAGYRTIY